MTRETKTFQAKISAKDITTNDTGQQFGQIECYAAVFNVVDDGNDRILEGAFSRTLKNAKSRAQARGKRYILPCLWNHDPNELIGGWHSLTEDSHGLLCKGDINLATQRGREYWELARSEMADQFSIVYETMPAGAKYNKDGVRDLSELRLFSCDPVTFAMCDETSLVSIKSTDLEHKSVIGTTSGPIGPRDESWDGSKAEGQIWDAAYDEDSGKINTSLAKKYFMVQDGDAQKKGSYSYPFWYVGDSPHICVGAVKAIAAAIQGSRGASAPDGLKSKVETLYKRINKKFPDDTPLTPPWDDGKRSNRPMATKDFNDHYREECIRDYLCTDFYNLTCALQKAVMDIFTIGDEPQSDVITTILDDGDDSKGFISALKDYVQKGIDLDVSNYLNEELNSNSYGGYPSYYGYMSNRAEHERKAMTASDASTSITSDHVDKLHGAATKAMKKVQDTADSLHEAADTVSSLVDGKKAGRMFSSANTQALSDHADDLHEKADALTKSVNRQMKTITTVADDLASVLQGSESAYGSEPGDAQDRTEGKATSHQEDVRRPHKENSSQGTAAKTTPPPQDTFSEHDLSTALDALHTLRTTTTIVA